MLHEMIYFDVVRDGTERKGREINDMKGWTDKKSRNHKKKEINKTILILKDIHMNAPISLYLIRRSKESLVNPFPRVRLRKGGRPLLYRAAPNWPQTVAFPPP